MYRRGVLRYAGVALSTTLAGCSLGASADVADIAVGNHADAERAVAVEVTRTSDGGTVHSETVTVRPSGRRTLGEPITESGTYRSHVTVENGPSGSNRWKLPRNDEGTQLDVTVESDSLTLVILAT